MSHPTAALNDVVHQRSRLGILAVLATGDRVDFGYLKTVLDLSAGNLSRHLAMLAEAHLITIQKGYHGSRPRTWVVITTAGSRAYGEEMIVLRSLIALADAVPSQPAEPPAAEPTQDANIPALTSPPPGADANATD